MRSIIALLLQGFAVSVMAARRPCGVSICDFHTSALFGNTTAQSEYNTLVAIVNTAVIGNYTQPNVGVAVTGILNPGTFNGKTIDLLPYFSGSLGSSNRGGSVGVSVNFLDGGGAAPLKQNLPATDNKSNQQ